MSVLARAAVAVALLAAGLLGCSGGDAGEPGDRADRAGRQRSGAESTSAGDPSSTPGTATTPVTPSAPAGLADAYTCRGGFTCGAFEVPRDHADPSAGTLTLQVAVETDDTAPRGVLLALNGGPGAAGAPLAPELAERFGAEVMAAYRLVVLDQRGTGPGALDCPALQESSGRSFVPSPDAVRACADRLGADRALYGTDDVVADLDLLRDALGVPGWTVFAVSYGTFVAQQYAVAHPGRVTALALDSPLPARGVDTLQADTARATARVLRSACAAARRCPGDPAADLATVVRRDGGGPDLLGMLSGMSTVRPSYDTLLPALRAAARGDRDELDRLLQAYRTGFATTPEVFSAALHSAAYCADQRFPWGLSDAGTAGRPAAVRRAVAAAGQVQPFDPATLRRGAGVVECGGWPPGEPSDVRRGDVRLPRVPVLMVTGTHDLSAPLESARRAARAAPRVRLVEVPRAGHVVTARPGTGRQVVRDFLLR